jgi:5'-deoxy-5'-methylthioadenosine phosphorylase
MLAILGGTGLDQLANLEISHREVVRTPYGEPSGALTFGKINKCGVVFLARHGYGHTIPPHQVNYRANIWALYAQKVSRVVSVGSVGGIRSDLVPGTIAIPNQLIDYTHGRAYTFFEGTNKIVTHIDFTEPYCATLRKALLEAARAAAESVVDGGVYAATQGPRLETAAEIKRLAKDGADMVGMTGMPEAALAKEVGLSYASISVVANCAAGLGSSSNAIKLEDIGPVLEKAMDRVRKLLDKLVASDGC